MSSIHVELVLITNQNNADYAVSGWDLLLYMNIGSAGRARGEHVEKYVVSSRLFDSL